MDSVYQKPAFNSMDKAQKFLNRWTEEAGKPRICPSFKEAQKEGYSCEWTLGKIYISAATPSLILQGVSRTCENWQAGYPQEALGTIVPSVKKRYFALEASAWIRKAFAVDPTERQRRADLLCEQILKTGCNGLMMMDGPEACDFALFRLLADSCKEYGLRFCSGSDGTVPVDDLLCSSVRWQKEVPRPCSDRGRVLLDCLHEELQEFSERVPAKAGLIYYIHSPSGTKRFWEHFLRLLPEDAAVAFPARSDDLFWDYWRSLGAAFPGTILPIIRPYSYGGGLWPMLDPCAQDDLIGVGSCVHWYGAALASASFPCEKSLSHCNLWSLSRQLWEPGKYGCSFWEEQWFKCYLPEVDYRSAAGPLKELAQLSRQVSAFCAKAGDYSYDRQRSFIETALGRTKCLCHVDWSVLAGPVKHCIADLRRLLFRAMLDHQIAIPQAVEESDLEGGFWTKIKAVAGQSVRSGAVVQVLQEPLLEDPYARHSMEWWSS